MLSKETQIVIRNFTVEKQKAGADAASMTVPTHVSAVFSYSEGYFAPEGMKNRFYNKCWGQVMSLTPKL